MIRKQRNYIEFYFKVFTQLKKAHDNKELDIIEANLVVSESCIGYRSKIGDPTAVKAARLIKLNEVKNWYSVINSVFESFRDVKPHIYEIMEAVYIKKKPLKKLLGVYISDITYKRWRGEWLDVAIERAKRYKLIS